VYIQKIRDVNGPAYWKNLQQLCIVQLAVILVNWYYFRFFATGDCIL